MRANIQPSLPGQSASGLPLLQPLVSGRRLRGVAILFLLATAAGGVTGCASADEDDLDSDSAAVTKKAPIVVDGAKAFFNNSEDGFEACPKPTSSNGATVGVTQSALENCRLKQLVVPTKDAVKRALQAHRSLFETTFGSRGNRLELDRIDYTKYSLKQSFTKLDASLDVGGQSGSVNATFAWAIGEYGTTFTFKQYDSDNNPVGIKSKTYSLANNYFITPYSTFNISAQMTLNLGAIVNAMGAGNPAFLPLATAVGSAGGSLKLSGEHGQEETSFKCVDMSNSKGGSQVFQNDVTLNVVKRLCVDYQAANGGDKSACNAITAGSTTEFINGKAQHLKRDIVYKLESCAKQQGLPTQSDYIVNFAAPADWGFDDGQHVNLYEATNVTNLWKRAWGTEDWMTVRGVSEPGAKCGGKTLPADRVCVTAALGKHEDVCMNLGKYRASQAKEVNGTVVVPD